MNYFSYLIPYLFFIPTFFFLLSIFQNIFNSTKAFSFSVAFFLTPITIGLSYYYLLTFFQGRVNYFYVYILTIINIILGLIAIIIKPKINFNLVNTVKHFFYAHPYIFIFSLSIFLLTIIRTAFWPINWGDQIIYLKQAYGYNLSKQGTASQIELQINNSFFDYNMSTAIQPLLPIIYSLFYLFNNDFYGSQFFAQSIISYFFLGVIMLLLFRHNEKNRSDNIISVFLILTCYYFINFTIYGFKELLIIGIIIISLQLIQAVNFKDSKKTSILILLGICLASLSLLNYSGTVIAGILIIITFLFYKSSIVKKVLISFLIFIIMCTVSLGEPARFYRWSFEGINSKTQNITGIFTAVITKYKENKNNTVIIENAQKEHEIVNFNIGESRFSYFTRSKFQGIFQIQFFGFIFHVFILVLILRFKHLIKNDLSRIFLLFILMFTAIVIDPFSLNPNKYSFVLDISPKYTLILVPLVAFILSEHISFIKSILQKIGITTTLSLLTSASIISLFVSKYLYIDIFHLLKFLIPTFQEPYYYYKLIKNITLWLSIFGFFVSFIIFIVYVFRQKKLIYCWKKHSVSFNLYFTTLFFIIFLIPFQSNYGISNIFTHTLANKETKLLHNNGGKNFFETIVYTKNMIIPKLNTNETLVFIDTDSVYSSFFLEVSPKLVGNVDKNKNISKQLEDYSAKYIFTTKEFYSELYKNDTYITFQEIFSNSEFVLLTYKSL